MHDRSLKSGAPPACSACRSRPQPDELARGAQRRAQHQAQGPICAGAQHRNTEQNTPQNVHFSNRNISATSLSFLPIGCATSRKVPLKGTCGVAPLGQPREKDPRSKTGVATRKRPPTLTSDNQMTPKPNLTLNA